MKLIRGQDWTKEDKIRVIEPTDEYPYWAIEIRKNDGSFHVWNITGNVVLYLQQNLKDDPLEVEYIFINE